MNIYNFIAHRGLNNKKYGENTLEAILDSLNESYIKGIEFDIRMTFDKKMVIHHDMTINRTSNGTGFISNMTLKELKKYNFGKEIPSKICTLKELLSSINTEKILLMELKYEGTNNEEYIDIFYKTISKYLNLNIYVMSFNEKLIKILKEKHPIIKCGLLIGSIINSDSINDNYDFIAMSSLNVSKIKKYQKSIFIWALKSKERYNELIKILPSNTYYIVDKPIKYIE